MQRVEIRLLGEFGIVVDGGEDAAARLTRRDPARLVKLLAVSPGHRLAREQVLDALWPDAPPASAANRLHKAAHYVRRATAGDDSALDAALAGYDGPLLPLDLYEDWAFHLRQRLELRYCELLRRAGRFDELLAVDPTDEQAHVGLMRDHLRRGDGPLELWRAFDELQRRSTSPRNARRLFYSFGVLDIAAAARQLDLPCLILHSVDDQVWSFAEAEDLHALIPGSTLVPLPSRNHILKGDEPAFALLIEAVERFLADKPK